MQIERFKQLEETLGEVYFHVNNGGTTVEVGQDGKGHPVIRVVSTHFGNVTGWLELSVTCAKLAELAQMFQLCASHAFPDSDASVAAR